MNSPLELTATDRLLVIAPHPDDETLGAGGLIQRAVAANAQIRVLFLTDGENNPWPQRYIEKRWRVRREDSLRWGTTRRREALEALARLGASPHVAAFLNLPDQGITQLLLHEPERLLAPLSAELQNWRPTLLATPCIEDVHPDHSALNILLRHALQHAGTAAPRVLYYLIHTNGIPLLSPRTVLTLTAAERARKHDAILAHRTQMALSRKRFLSYASPGEAYYNPLEESTSGAFHSAVLHDGRLILRMHPRVVIRRRARLLLAWNDAEGRFQSKAIPLPKIQLHHTRSGPELHIVPPPSFSLDQPLALKYQLKRIYFEQFGWQTLRVLAPFASPLRRTEREPVHV